MSPPDRAAILAQAEGSRLAVLEGVWVKALQALHSNADPRQTGLLTRAEAEARAALDAARAAAAPPAPAPAEPEAPVASFDAKQALAYLRRGGWKVSRSKLYADTATGLIGRTREGAYTKKALDDYAAGLKTFTGETVEEKVSRLAREKQEADTRQAVAQADRREIQRDRERGMLVERARMERELAARALQLRGDFESWAMEVPLRLVERYNLGADAIAEIRKLILDAGKEWFGRYTAEREFVHYLGGPGADVAGPGGDLGGRPVAAEAGELPA